MPKKSIVKKDFEVDYILMETRLKHFRDISVLIKHFNHIVSTPMISGELISNMAFDHILHMNFLVYIINKSYIY